MLIDPKESGTCSITLHEIQGLVNEVMIFLSLIMVFCPIRGEKALFSTSL